MSHARCVDREWVECLRRDELSEDAKYVEITVKTTEPRIDLLKLSKKNDCDSLRFFVEFAPFVQFPYYYPNLRQQRCVFKSIS